MSVIDCFCALHREQAIEQWMQPLHFNNSFHLLGACNRQIGFIGNIDPRARQQMNQYRCIERFRPYFDMRGGQATISRPRDNIVISDKHVIWLLYGEDQAITVIASRPPTFGRHLHQLGLLCKHLTYLFQPVLIDTTLFQPLRWQRRIVFTPSQSQLAYRCLLRMKALQ